MKNPLRSPAFRRWFGDSKVVDGRGKPLVVYHGTPRGGFTSFRSGRRGLFFFTADRNVASSYIGPLADELLDSDFEAEPTPGVGQPPRKGVPGIYRVYLRLSNPLVFDADGRGFDEIYPEAIGLEGQDDLTVDEIAVMARQQGYDGLIVSNLYDTGLYSDYTEPSTVYVAFDPRQIKSATVQRGTYDPDSTDIRENPRANQKKTLTVQDTPAFQQWFRGSKVVDQDGRPLVMYHGTPKADFTVFRAGRHAFFTTSLVTAQSYGKAEKVPLLKKIPGKAAPGVYAVYLRIENPLVVEAGGRDHYEIRTRAVPAPREDIARVLNTTWVPPELSTEQIAVVAERLGYDGVIFHDLLDDSGGDWGNVDAEPSTVCAVFSPAQVKSATGNRGTYDPRSLDIRENVSSTTGRHPDLDSLVLYHGAQRWEGPPRLQPAGKNKSENGSGLYLTTNPDTARRYAKGGGSVLIFELDPDLRWADQVRIPHQEVLLFLRALPRLKHRDRIEADLAKYEPVGVPAFVLENLMLFHGALVGDKGPALAEFFVSQGIDAGHARQSAEDWVVLYNLDKIRSYRKVTPKEAVTDSSRVRPNDSDDGEDYRGEHGSPDPESGAPMHDVESMMPDYCEHPDWYFTNDDGLDRAAAAAIRRVRGKPYAHVEVFRAVPKGVRKINPGDWVTTVRAYAKDHLDSALNGQGRILKAVARAGSLFTAGDSHFEWGWWPNKEREDAYLRQLRTSPAWQARYGAHRSNGRQETSFTCGPAAMQTVLDSFGIYRRQSDLARELGTTAAEGTRPDALLRCAWSEGLHAKQSRNTRFETVVAAVRRGARVILNFQAWPERGQRVGQGAQDGHYAVVQRATDEELVLVDPSSERPVLLSREDLEDRWYDVDADGHPVHRLAIFIEGAARPPVPLRQQESSTP